MLAAVLYLAAAVLPGERLEYDVRYGPLRLGSLVLRSLPVDSVAGQECQHFSGELELSHAVSWLFQARYELESWCRLSDMVTLRSRKLTRETNFAAEWTAEFKPDSGIAVYSDGARLRLRPQSRDLLGLWFYLRSAGLKSGDVRVVNGHVDRRNHRLRVVGAGWRNVRVPAGRFRCLVVSPSTQGPLGAVYLADDSSRLPVVIQTKAAGLMVSAQLRKVGQEEP